MEVRWTEEAARCLEDIHGYIALDNPDAARQTAAAIYEKAVGLGRFPQLGRLHRITSAGEIRIVLYEHYRIVYLLPHEGPIQLLGIFHGALDLESLL